MLYEQNSWYTVEMTQDGMKTTQLDMVTFAQNSGARSWGIFVSLRTTWSTKTLKPDKATQRDLFHEGEGVEGEIERKKMSKRWNGGRRKEKNPAPGVDKQELYSDSSFCPTLRCVRTTNPSNRNKKVLKA